MLSYLKFVCSSDQLAVAATSGAARHGSRKLPRNKTGEASNQNKTPFCGEKHFYSI